MISMDLIKSLIELYPDIDRDKVSSIVYSHSMEAVSQILNHINNNISSLVVPNHPTDGAIIAKEKIKNWVMQQMNRLFSMDKFSLLIKGQDWFVPGPKVRGNPS